MTTPIAIWDWERDPVPIARVVVCRPGLYSTPVGIETADPRTRMLAHVVYGGAMVLPFEAHLMPSFKMRRGIIPALYAERQSDLDGVGELLAVQADRRALVLCPREALALSDETQDPETDPCRGCRGYTNEGGDNCGSVRGPGIDLVVIIPPPEARTCEACHGAGRRWKRSSPDERWTDYPEVCSECHGSGRIEPWSIQPDWVRGIAEQCRAAGVPVADLTSDAPSALPEWLT